MAPEQPGDRTVRHVLTINTGSSSVKVALYAIDTAVTDVGECELTIAVDQHRQGADFAVAAGDGEPVFRESHGPLSHEEAVRHALTWLEEHGYTRHLAGVGHRVVHGGTRYSAPTLITPEVSAALRGLIPIAPDHLPQAIAAIEVLERACPHLSQVACFDTAFHRRMPRIAQIYALPYHLATDGVLRYGFHGLSYEYIMDRLHRLDEPAARKRIVIAHLGNGSSMVAVRDGTSVDTTMGFTPAGGLVMSTRCGDLDPGPLIYLLHERRVTATELGRMLNEESGLLGVSGTSADMRDLLEREANDERASLAVELYCYHARKHLAALVATLGGIDALVFTAGIGEHSAAIRERICRGLEFLGIQLHAGRNSQQAPIISPDGSTVTVRVIHTDEDLMIARHTVRVLADAGVIHVSI